MAGSLRLAYLVFAHKNPAQLGRLLHRLYYPGCTFYVYVDAKADVRAFQDATVGIPAGTVVWLPKRKPISWGDFSLSAAYLYGFEVILQQRPEPDFIITISGQDYPIATNEAIHNWLGEHIDQSIIDHELVTEDSPHLIERIERYYLSIKAHRTLAYPYPDANDFRKKAFNTVLGLSGLFTLPRRLPLDHQMYFGTNWFQLKPTAARYVIDFARTNPDYLRFSRTTYVPEEFFFQTILAHAPDALRHTLCNQRMTFMQWDRPPGSYFIPLSTDDLPAMLHSEKFFARKFDLHHDSTVLDRLDQYLDEQLPVV